MSPDRDVIAFPLPRLPELGAMASVCSALASEAVCLNASRMLAGRDRGEERQNHNDNLGHRCQLSVYENVGKKRATSRGEAGGIKAADLVHVRPPVPFLGQGVAVFKAAAMPPV
jgi:hypothetical protein